MQNKSTDKKERIVKAMMEVDYSSILLEDQVGIEKYDKLPLPRIQTLGIAFEPLAAAFQFIASGGEATSGLYRVTIPNGGHLASFKNESAFLGSVLKENNAVGGGQARLNPLVFNPTMLFMAATLASLDKKLDAIQEIQQDILDFLVQKERSELKGDLDFLTDTYKSYKYNWDNEKYKNSNHIKALDIKQTAERKIDFFRQQITSKVNKNSFFRSDKDVKKQIGTIQVEFKDYQTALYLYSFASLVEVLLLENFDGAYLNSITDKLEGQAFKYRDLYTKCYDQIEKYTNASIQSQLLKGLASVNKYAGETMAKVPVISKTQIDETLIASNQKLEKFGKKRAEQTMEQFIETQSSYAKPFINGINTINRLHNQPIEVFFDKDCIYIDA